MAAAAGGAATKKLAMSGAFSLVRRCGGIRMSEGQPRFSSSAVSPPPVPPVPPPPRHHWNNPPDQTNPDPVTLQEQWRFAIRMYSKWYAHAWGTAIVAGLTFYGLGWVIKGYNPLRLGPQEKKEAALNPEGATLKPE